MPPKPMVVGATAIGDFLGQAIFAMAPMRLVGGHTNGSPAFAAYVPGPAGGGSVLFALLVIGSDGRQITNIDAFSDPRTLAAFELP